MATRRSAASHQDPEPSPLTLEQILQLPPESIDNLEYEAAMAALDQVVEALETEGTPLALGIDLYEAGMRLSRRCGQLLDATEARMARVLRGADGQIETVDFDVEKDGR